MKTQTFRLLGFFEASSLLILLFLAMPLKYIYGIPLAVRIVGSIHGALFTLYIISGFFYAKQARWSFAKLLFAYFLAVVPFGTFILDKKLFSSQNL